MIDEKEKQVKDMIDAQKDLLKKITSDVKLMNKKLKKKKINMVTEFVDKQETKRISCMQIGYKE